MTYHGFYINLDRRPDRRAEIEAELGRHGLAYRRFAAVDGNAKGYSNPHLKNGEIGCYTSHMMLLREHIGATQPLHVIEDDVLFSPLTAAALNGIVAQNMIADYDILYTDIGVPVNNSVYKALRHLHSQAQAAGGAALSFFNLRETPFSSLSSYLVNPRSIGKLHDLLATDIAAEPRLPADLFIRDKVAAGDINAGCLFPFITSVRLDEIVDTDIARDCHRQSALAAHIARYAFFVDADFALCRDYINRFFALPPADDLIATLNHILAFSLTDGYRSF